jgi:hypothetical protein
MYPILLHRTHACFSSGILKRSSPMKWIVPEVGMSSAPIMLKKVDFPDPDGPMIDRYSPS